MENKNEILTNLARIRDAGAYSEGDIEYLEVQLDHDDEAIRAAAILATEGCLYNTTIVDRILLLGQNDESLPVRRAAIKMLGTFVTACVLEGFESPDRTTKGLEFEEDFDELLEKNIEEKYEEVKSWLLEEIVLKDYSDELYPDLLTALSELAFREDVKEKIEEAWNVSDEATKSRLIPSIERYPEKYESLIINGLEDIQDSDTTIQLLELAQEVPTDAMARMVETFLNSADEKIVAQALLTLAQINKTDGLNDILQQYCLHENEHIQLAARKALDVFSAKNFNDFMKQYF